MLLMAETLRLKERMNKILPVEAAYNVSKGLLVSFLAEPFIAAQQFFFQRIR